MDFHCRQKCKLFIEPKKLVKNHPTILYLNKIPYLCAVNHPNIFSRVFLSGVGGENWEEMNSLLTFFCCL